MFESLFASKNKKIVLKLQKEHQQILSLVKDIQKAYDRGDDQCIRTLLIELENVVLDHLMTEDVEFYRLVRDPKRSTKEIEYLIKQFEENFDTIKLALIDFLDKYTDENAYYKEEFIKHFHDLVAILGARIEFEEKYLYGVLKAS